MRISGHIDLHDVRRLRRLTFAGRAYGLQFHVELGRRDLPMLRERMNPARVASVEALEAVEGVGMPLLDRFLDTATTARDGSASPAR